MSEAYAGKARAFMSLQNYREALKVIEDAIKTFQNDPELYYIRGLLNFQRAKPVLAIEDYTKALSINAEWNTCQVLLNRGVANEALLNTDQAIEDFTKAIAADPNQVGAYTARGNALYNTARYKDATDDFKKAETLTPDNSVIIYNIGMSYFKDGDKATACKYFQKSCSLENNNACKMVVLNCSDRK
jgi:tetratricopeptide (TPR) repeat protein